MKPMLITLVFIFSSASAFAADAPAPAATAPANQIIITNYKYAPSALTVTAGTKVTWVNHDQIPHTIVDSTKDKTFRSGALDTNDTYSFTFTTPGTYKYFCTLHPQMVGTITVTATP